MKTAKHKEDTIFSFEQLAEEHEQLCTTKVVGGKALNLVKMTRAKLKDGFFKNTKIPTGFVITTRSFLQFLKNVKLFSSSEEATLHDKIKSSMSSLLGIQEVEPFDAQEESRKVRTTCEELRKLIESSQVPDFISLELSQHLSPFDSTVRFAVRSSATSEDLADQSFAGQHQTILNCSNSLHSITSALLKCWASVFNEGAILYRLSYKRQHKHLYEQNPHLLEDLLIPQMAIVVQEMVNSVTSGVMFTADITTSNRRRIIIEAAHGLGETIVSGKVKPDKYIVDKRNPKKILEKKIEEKTVAIICNNDEGTFEKEIHDKSEREKQILSEEQVAHIAQCGLDLEEMNTCPQDVEFAYNSMGELCLLQSRAITSLFPLPVPLTPCFKESLSLSSSSSVVKQVVNEKIENVYVSASHIQVMTDPMTYFGLSLLLMWGNWMLGVARDIPHRIVTPANRLYMSFSDLWSVKSIGAKFAAGLGAVDVWISKSLAYAFQTPEFIAHHPRLEKLKFFMIAYKAFFLIIKIFYNILFLSFEKIKEFMETISDAAIKAQQEKCFKPETTSLRNIADKTHEFGRELMYFVYENWVPRMQGPVLMSVGLLNNMVPADAKESFQDMLKGVVLKTTEMDMMIQNVVRATCANASLLEKVKQLVAAKKSTKISGAELLQLLQEEDASAYTCAKKFFEEFGFRGYREVDAGRDRYIEDATFIAQMICYGPQEHQKGMDKLIAEGDAAAERVLTAIRKATKWSFMSLLTCNVWYMVKMRIATKLCHNVRKGFGLRETPKHIFMKSVMIVKELVLKYTKIEFPHLTQADIMYLMIEELQFFANEKAKIVGNDSAALAELHSKIADLIQKRKIEFEKFEKMQPPRVIMSSGENVEYTVMQLEAAKDTEQDPLTLRGTGVSNGIVQGIVKIVLDPSKAELKPGEILVARNVDPGFNPLFLHAKALVAEVGGMLTHGSVVCRELGIPGVVSVPFCTTKLKDGQLISVNGTSGIVKILEQRE